MYKTRLGDPFGEPNQQQLGYDEMDPSARYGRFKEILGKGAMKTVYRAFDEVLGMEVAWNQVKFADVFRTPEELQRLHSEVHLLKNLDHESIIRYHTSWVDTDRRTFNFITELFTSGTLREYRQRYKRVSIQAVKNWARQILRGLVFLHHHDPPVIHRDLKCDNIFINGHLGQVKIGDLGLAAILRGSQQRHSVLGTPEFMAPELYEEKYDELVDVYSFGMCVLEMLTSEYPYGECSNPAQIYKKVTSGKLPDAFYRIQDSEAQRFVGKCLDTASKRPSAQELFMDPFLAIDEKEEELLPTVCNSKALTHGSTPNASMENLLALLPESTRNTDMMITGTMNPDDDNIFLKVKIFDKDGKARNIYFPFDIVNDTAMNVAMEMVKELEITDREASEIAQMIDEEISALVPTWKDLDSPQNHRQQSFNYGDEDDDDSTHNPFYSLSSHSSFQSSFSGFYTPSNAHNHGSNVMCTSAHDEWFQDDLLFNDDASSQSSLNSCKYSNLRYCSVHESEFDSSPKTGEPQLSSKTQNSTRFCPEDITSNEYCHYKFNLLQRHQNLTRVTSLVDIRSQLLRRSLAEEINKQRLFKTVGVAEGIGYQKPACEIREEEPLVCVGFPIVSHKSGNQKHGFHC